MFSKMTQLIFPTNKPPEEEGEKEIRITKTMYEDLLKTISDSESTVSQLQSKIESLEKERKLPEETKPENSTPSTPAIIPQPKPKSVCLFTGIRVSPEAAAELEKFRDKIKANKQFSHWTHVKDFHVTLQFYGNVEESKIPELEEVLSKVAENNSPFDLFTSIPQTFGGKTRPHVLFIAPDGDCQALQKLGKEIQTSCSEKFGFKKDQVYNPHITIGKNYKSRAPFIEPVEADFPQKISFKVTQFDLLLSDPSAEPRYHTVKTFELSGNENLIEQPKEEVSNEESPKN